MMDLSELFYNLKGKTLVLMRNLVTIVCLPHTHNSILCLLTWNINSFLALK